MVHHGSTVNCSPLPQCLLPAVYFIRSRMFSFCSKPAKEYYSTYARRLTSTEFVQGTVQSMERDEDGFWRLQTLGI